MKRCLLVFPIVVLLFSISLEAQDRSGFGLKVGVFSADGDNHQGAVDDRGTVGITYLYPISDHFKLEGSLEYMTDGSVVSVDWDGVSSDLDIIPITVTLRYQDCTNDRFCPYVGAGLGIYHGWILIDINSWGMHIDESDTALGFHAALGFDAPLKRGSSFTGEVRYADAELELDAGDVSIIWGDESDTFPRSIDFEGFVVTFGYRFRF